MAHPPYGNPPPGGYQPPQQPQGYPPPQQQEYPPQQQQQSQVTGPQIHAYNEQQMQAYVQQSQQTMDQRQADFERVRGPRPIYLKVPGPEGQLKWELVPAGQPGHIPIGYEGQTVVQICGPWSPNAPGHFVETTSHFYKTAQYPRGVVRGCPDDGTCAICLGRKAALVSTDPVMNERGNTWGKQRRQIIYNVFDLTYPQGHFDEKGVMRPHILSAGANLHKDLMLIFKDQGSRLLDYQQGTPVRIVKKKTGNEAMNVEYRVIHLSPAPLDQYFWPGTYNLWDLLELAKPSPPEELQKAAQEIGFPLVGDTPAVHQVPASYNPQPAPPHANPYPPQGASAVPPPPAILQGPAPVHSGQAGPLPPPPPPPMTTSGGGGLASGGMPPPPPPPMTSGAGDSSPLPPPPPPGAGTPQGGGSGPPF